MEGRLNLNSNSHFKSAFKTKSGSAFNLRSKI